MPTSFKTFCVSFYMRAFQVKDLLWNNDSTVLAVWLEDMTAAADKPVHTYSELDQFISTFFLTLIHILRHTTKQKCD